MGLLLLIDGVPLGHFKCSASSDLNQLQVGFNVLRVNGFNLTCLIIGIHIEVSDAYVLYICNYIKTNLAL